MTFGVTDQHENSKKAGNSRASWKDTRYNIDKTIYLSRTIYKSNEQTLKISPPTHKWINRLNFYHHFFSLSFSPALCWFDRNQWAHKKDSKHYDKLQFIRKHNIKYGIIFRIVMWTLNTEHLWFDDDIDFHPPTHTPWDWNHGTMCLFFFSSQ